MQLCCGGVTRGKAGSCWDRDALHQPGVPQETTPVFGAPAPELSEYSKGKARHRSCAVPPWEIPSLCSSRAASFPPCSKMLRLHFHSGEDGKLPRSVARKLLGKVFLSKASGSFSATPAFSVPLAVPAVYGKSRPAADSKALFQDRTCQEE